MNLATIISPIAIELQKFEAQLSQFYAAAPEPLADVMGYLSESKGKRIRPALVFLSAKLLGEANGTTCRTALFVELLHTATLLHDDVVDGDEVRRGRPSANARFGNMQAVLTGDYLLAKAVQLIAQPADHLVMEEMMQTAIAMGEGELLQMRSPTTALGEKEYLDVVTRKTAMLMRSCCVGGALSVGADKVQVSRLAEFGLNLGIVFQMRDDILDGDQPECVYFAKQLISSYVDKALKSLNGLPENETMQAMKDLLTFCAEREY